MTASGDKEQTGSISLVMPLYNAEHLLSRVLPPLKQALARGDVAEVLVVDDSSSDGGADVCRAEGLEVMPSGGRLGPAGCRNLAAERAVGDILLFIDSDVVMHADVPAKVAETFSSAPDCVAVFGSYDDEPEARGVVTRYRNLLHHYVHQHGREEASTFWAGCGAVLREVFLDVGGFDTERYPHPSIEDIELGRRLLARGRVRLRKDIQGKHLKRWTLWSMVHTDIFRRALPWSRLLLSSGQDVNDLNLTLGERLKAIVAGLFWSSLAVALLWPWSLAVSAVLLAVAWLVNAEFFALVRRKNGLGHTLGALVLHQLYYLYSSVVFAYCLVESLFRRRG